MRRLILLLPALLLVAACAGSEKITSADIVETVPWSAPDTAEYRILDDNDDEVGTMTLTIEEDGAAVHFRQHFDFPDKDFTNEANVIASADELQPSSADFRIDGPDGTITCEATYASGEVSAHRVGEDGERTDTKDVPVIAYDSWSDLFLWRTIGFAEGAEYKYADVLSCTLDKTQVLSVTLKVKKIEEVEVPAGTFETWRVEIDSGGETQKAWFTTDDEHRLVKYDNGREVFELTPED